MKPAAGGSGGICARGHAAERELWAVGGYAGRLEDVLSISCVVGLPWLSQLAVPEWHWRQRKLLRRFR